MAFTKYNSKVIDDIMQNKALLSLRDEDGNTVENNFPLTLSLFASDEGLGIEEIFWSLRTLFTFEWKEYDNHWVKELRVPTVDFKNYFIFRTDEFLSLYSCFLFLRVGSLYFLYSVIRDYHPSTHDPKIPSNFVKITMDHYRFGVVEINQIGIVSPTHFSFRFNFVNGIVKHSTGAQHPWTKEQDLNHRGLLQFSAEGFLNELRSSRKTLANVLLYEGRYALSNTK